MILINQHSNIFGNSSFSVYNYSSSYILVSARILTVVRDHLSCVSQTGSDQHLNNLNNIGIGNHSSKSVNVLSASPKSNGNKPHGLLVGTQSRSLSFQLTSPKSLANCKKHETVTVLIEPPSSAPHDSEQTDNFVPNHCGNHNSSSDKWSSCKGTMVSAGFDWHNMNITQISDEIFV